MKIAVLTDIHANYRALETIVDHIDRWKPDQVIVAGDIINRGPRSLCCLQLISEKMQNQGWQVIRGNHEDYVIEREQPDDPKSGIQYEMYQPVHFTYRQLNEDLTQIRALPTELNLDFGRLGDIRVCHASMLGNRDGIYPENTDSEIKRKISPAPGVFITGHTHRPLIRQINQSLVVNAGSAGLPFDGDTRATYAQIFHQNGGWHASIIRLDYDLEKAEQDFHDYGFVSGGGPLVGLILLELQTGLGQLYQWVYKYYPLIKNQDISVALSVKEFLDHPVSNPYW